MSLKAIHIVFIIASTVLALGFGAWCLDNYFGGIGTKTDLMLGLGSLVSAVVLIVYGRYFLKKLRHIGYL